MSTLYLLKYNNYFNRVIKKEANLAAYLTAVGIGNYKKFEDINFFYNDQVNTTQTINWPVLESEQEYDYLIVDNPSYGMSRWFIIEAKWNRQKQRIFTLRRDLIVDFLNDIKSQPFFCEKGNIVTNSTATMSKLLPIISQPENVQFSQILKGRQFIQEEESGSPVAKEWIVGYMDKNYTGGVYAGKNAIYFNDISEYDLAKYDNLTFQQLKNTTELQASWALTDQNQKGYQFISTKDQLETPNTEIYSWGDWVVAQNMTNLSDRITVGNTIRTNLQYFFNQYQDELLHDDYAVIQELLNQPTIVIGKKAYKWSYTAHTNTELVYQGGNYTKNIAYIVNGSGTVTQPIIPSPTFYPDAVSTYYFFRVKNVDTYTFNLEEDTSVPVYTWPATYQNLTVPYGIFFTEYTAAAAKEAANLAARYAGSGFLYDIQRLPYKPISTGPVYVNSTGDHKINGIIWYWATQENKFNLTTALGDAAKSYSGVLGYKTGALCDTMRIVSPNQANSWDFNPAQNGGVSKYQIRCTYKPYSPLISIKPLFDEMYGSTATIDANWQYTNGGDSRGLICGGSFSLPLVNDKWSTFQLNNKAYYDSFSRDIENLSTVQKYQRQQEIIGAIVGTIQGAATGGATGGMISGGSGAGAAVGAAIGATASAIGGIADIEMNDKLRAEALDYKKDQFGFNCQNMIASPRTLTRVDSFDMEYARWPYVEFYTASPIEKANLRSKIRYNGYSINYTADANHSSFGFLVDGLKGALNAAGNTTGTVDGTSYTVACKYVKGKLIWTGGVDDTHVYNEISAELFKGIYWEGGTVS